MNTFEFTFEKHKRLLKEHLDLNENEAQIQAKIDQYKNDKRVWNMMAKGDFEAMISNGEIPEEFQEYYPGWSIDDIKAVYRGVEGKDYNG